MAACSAATAAGVVTACITVASKVVTGGLAAARRSGASTRTYSHAQATNAVSNTSTTNAPAQAPEARRTGASAELVAVSFLAVISQKTGELHRPLVEEEEVGVARDVQAMADQRGQEDAD